MQTTVPLMLTLFLEFAMVACWSPPFVLLCQLFPCVKLQMLPVFRLFFVSLFGQVPRRWAGCGLLSALGNGLITGASSTVWRRPNDS